MRKASRNYGQSAMQSTISRILVGLILAALAGAGPSAANETMTPLERVASAPKGDLKNPFTDVASVAEEGHKIYMSHDCGSCHGGGGMAAPLTNEVWIYGNADDTLFRSAPAASAPAMRSASKASCARAPRTSLGQCRPSASYSRPTPRFGRSSPELGRSIPKACADRG